MELANLTTVEVGRRAAIIAIPIGSTEQHGPHLPLSTDTEITIALCRRLAATRGDVLVAPALAYGSSGEHAGFAGTLSIGQFVLERVLIELGRSASETFPHLLFISAHYGNAQPAARAVATLRAESRDVLLFQPRWVGDAHAGQPETSLLLALAPEHVHMNVAAPGDTRPLAQIWPLLRSGGVRAVTATGVLGDPSDANAAEGERLLDEISYTLMAEVAAWRKEEPA